MKNFVIALIIAVFLTGILSAQGPFGQKPGKTGSRGLSPGENSGRIAQRGITVVSEYLELDQGQIETLKQLLENRRSATQEIMRSTYEDSSTLRELLDSGNPDPAAVGSLVISIHNQRETISDIQNEFVSNFKAILSPEQLALYEEVTDRMGRNRILPAFRALRLFDDPGFNRRNRGGRGPGFAFGPGLQEG